MKMSMANELFTTSGNAIRIAMPSASQSQLRPRIIALSPQGRSA